MEYPAVLLASASVRNVGAVPSAHTSALGIGDIAAQLAGKFCETAALECCRLAKLAAHSCIRRKRDLNATSAT